MKEQAPKRVGPPLNDQTTPYWRIWCACGWRSDAFGVGPYREVGAVRRVVRQAANHRCAEGVAP